MNIDLPLVIGTILYLFAWLPISAAKSKQYGNKYLASNRSADISPLIGWGGRAFRAYENLKDFYLGFVVAILILKINGSVTDTTIYLAWAYIILRVLHYFFYSLGIVPMRFLVWISALIINIYLLIKAI